MSEVGLKRILVTAAMSALVALSATPAHASGIRITALGSAPDDPGLQTDPAIIGSDGFRLTYWTSNETLLNPLMLILAVPEGTGDPLMPEPIVVANQPTADVTVTSTQYGASSWDPITGAMATPYNSTSPSNVYDFIGFKPSGVSSENYANWTGATGLTSWNLFVYTVYFDPLLNKKDYVEFTTSLPVGSFVIGYGCSSTGSTCSGTQGDTQSTPFTFAGNVAVPEPASVLLMLTGIGIALARARRLT